MDSQPGNVCHINTVQYYTGWVGENLKRIYGKVQIERVCDFLCQITQFMLVELVLWQLIVCLSICYYAV